MEWASLLIEIVVRHVGSLLCCHVINLISHHALDIRRQGGNHYVLNEVINRHTLYFV